MQHLISQATCQIQASPGHAVLCLCLFHATCETHKDETNEIFLALHACTMSFAGILIHFFFLFLTYVIAYITNGNQVYNHFFPLEQ